MVFCWFWKGQELISLNSLIGELGLKVSLTSLVSKSTELQAAALVKDITFQKKDVLFLTYKFISNYKYKVSRNRKKLINRSTWLLTC